MGMRWLCLALISIGLAGCSLNQAETKTALVQQVEQAGAGDLSKASTGGDPAMAGEAWRAGQRGGSVLPADSGEGNSKLG